MNVISHTIGQIVMCNLFCERNRLMFGTRFDVVGQFDSCRSRTLASFLTGSGDPMTWR